MPNFTAHFYFGRCVYDALSPQARARIALPFFDCGQLGSDPLFFYPIPASPAISREGHALHRQSARPVVERLRGGSDAAFSYAAGYLCHFWLDSTCHPFIYRTASSSGISHMQMEGEFDRYLRRTTLLPSLPAIWPQSTDVLQIASQGYCTPTSVQFGTALRAFDRFCRLIDRISGTPVASVVNVFTLRNAFAHGVILGQHPHPLSRQTNPVLFRQLRAAIPNAARAVEQLDAAFQTSAPLDFIPHCDHAGRPCEESEFTSILPI